jgi:hypothetical protein
MLKAGLMALAGDDEGERGPVFYSDGQGKIDIGAIDGPAAEAIEVNAFAIRVEEGIPGANGFGLAHIESNPSRMDLIKKLGYASAQAFVFDICKNWDTISEADGARFAISKTTKGYSFKAIIAPKAHNGKMYWSVTTALPSRPISKGILYRKPTG